MNVIEPKNNEAAFGITVFADLNYNERYNVSFTFISSVSLIL